MAPVNNKTITLYEEAKAGLGSLVQQTVTVFIGFAVMLLVAGGAPSGFVVGLSFCIGTAFVAWSEQKRMTKTRVRSLNNYTEVLTCNVQRDATSDVASTVVIEEAKYGETDQVYVVPKTDKDVIMLE